MHQIPNIPYHPSKIVPSLVGPDQGWNLIRRIEVYEYSCAVYEVNDNWHPRVDEDDRIFYYPKLGKGRKAGIKWNKAPLGKYTDAQLAESLGVGRTTVAQARRRRSVASYKKKKTINWDKQPLGEIPDAALAKKLGVSPGAVWKARQKRGIEAID